MRKSQWTVSMMAMALSASLALAESGKIEREGPLKDLPSEPKGEHMEKIAALGDNEWVDLGSPEPDAKWGKARGRSWSPVAPYAPDLRGAFFFGEGPHGMVKPDGHYMDDLWFYDVNQHRWVCVYPGIHAAEGYKEIGFDKETGFEVTPDGQPIPIASMVHAYCMVTYDSDRGLFMNMGCSGGYWRPGYHKGITGRVEALKEHSDAVKKAREAGEEPAWAGSRGTSPYIYNTRTGRFERYRTENPSSPGGFGATLIYVPSVQKAFGYKNRSSRVAWYDPETKDWTEIRKKGSMPPWHIDPNVCYDSKRDRIYLAGGLYSHIKFKPGDSVLWMFDVQTETFSRLEPAVTPTPTSYATNRAMFFYDSVNDAVVMFMHRVRKNETRGIYVYHPERNEWELVSENTPQLDRRRNPTWTGYYDPELNAFLLHTACDGSDNGTMFAYRYKRQ